MLAPCLAIALLTSCIPMHRAPDLDRIAVEEWYRAAPPVALLRHPIKVVVCVGLTSGAVATPEGITVYLQWPLNKSEAAARCVIRYELSKLAYVQHAADVAYWLWPLAAVDAFLHLPTSEAHSWWRMFVPGEIEWSEGE